ncbi:cytochrome b [Microbulbifer sediminum]|uniref:cytochrome b n=1 Tax=Microbulbifer sediminum TaxID=2904250 RepID=UPI001F16C472|nr:cytochrome b [Microbulbifer sediminum]
MANTAPTQWHFLSRSLHWLIAVFFLFAWASVELHESYERGDPMRTWWMVLHFSIGLTILLLVFARIYGRAKHPRPQLYGGRWQRKVSLSVEGLMYVVMLAMPITGLAMRQFEGDETLVFWLFKIPAFVQENEGIAEQLEFFHKELIWNTFLGLLVLHVAGALWHHFGKGDATLRHMLPWSKSE